ncbi:MAG: GSCFA domain-containing protein [Flavobacteriales bacterium]|nr:GSCFA domain-containing protein [Flavobacteriales bacterium]
MNLQTHIAFSEEARPRIDYQSKLLLLGSCFSEHIGDQLSYFKFQVVQNPLGILFHPKAIERLISSAIDKKEYSEKDVFTHNERWHSFDAHSKLSDLSKNNVLSNLNLAIEKTRNQLVQATHLIITLGTAWVYRHIESDRIVANCHKVPNKHFLKELLSVDAITESLSAIIAQVSNINPKGTIIFTVSPVRHLKEGVVENLRSKSHLITGLHRVVDTENHMFYFPSYELMMDELRDYRFYAGDMIHPNETAIQYIWNTFERVWISKSELAIMSEVDSVQKRLNHMPFYPESEEHRLFLERLSRDIKSLKQRLPLASFEKHRL